jgi:uncharacterized membrane protein
VLGWLDTPLPHTAHRIAGLSLLVAVALVLTRGPDVRSRLRVAAAPLLLLTAGAVILAQYLSWTPVGAHAVEGVQGRYFLPVAACAATTAWTVPMTVMIRYYG